MMKHTTESVKKTQAGIFVSSRQFSWAISLLLCISFFLFFVGYFWGQRRALEQFVDRAGESSFADRISYALYTMHDYDIQELAEEGGEEKISDEELGEQTIELKELEVQPVVAEELKGEFEYVAPLVGFGTLQAANQFAQRSKIYGIPVIVKKRTSKTKKGRTIHWYQAVSKVYETREELERVITQIKDKEHIKDINIIERKKG